mgnify:CR=1 FL=1|jgi:hypothetical protein
MLSKKNLLAEPLEEQEGVFRFRSGMISSRFTAVRLQKDILHKIRNTARRKSRFKTKGKTPLHPSKKTHAGMIFAANFGIFGNVHTNLENLIPK